MVEVTFNGYAITDEFIVGNLSREFMVRDVRQVDVPGMDGALFASARFGTVKIGMDVAFVAADPTERSDALRGLAAALKADSPGRLAISDDGGRYYLAVPNGGEVARFRSADRFRLEFTALDPAMYGNAASATVPSGGTVTFEVGGNYPTMPSIAASAAVRDPSSLVYGLRLDSGHILDFATSTDSAVSLSVDCQSRSASQDGTSVIPTLESDWFVLQPGTHTVENHEGTGAAEVSWVERWI